MILIDNREALIGDFLGTIPAMQKLSEEGIVYVQLREEAKKLFGLIENDRIKGTHIVDDLYFEKQVTLSNTDAFQISSKLNCYMSQAFVVQSGYDLPEIPPKAHLKFIGRGSTPDVDYYISPFARSLPESQKWPQDRWRKLVRSRPELKFGLFGNTKYDPENYLVEHNVIPVFDQPFDIVCDFLVHSKGLISVVTGTSHLAFHLGKKNILLTSQTMAWGNNPDAIRIQKQIHDITVEEVLDKL